MKTVLVVDDVVSEVDLISGYLRDAGYDVIPAMDAQEALDKAVNMQPDAIVTDVVMPGKSGYELCRSLKRHSATAKLPVVVCTSKDQDIDRLWGMKQGVDVYITKPFSQDELIQAIRSLVGS